MNPLEIVAENIKHYRKERELSQEDLSLKATMDRTYITKLEKAKLNVSILNIFRVAEALEVEPYMLLIEQSWKKKRRG